MVNEEVLKIVLNDKTFGRDQAADIVGGLSRLNHLIDKGKIRSVKKKETQCAKVYDIYTLTNTDSTGGRV